MRFSGTVEILAPRERVWEFLMDPNQVGSCGPGVQSIEEIDPDHFNIKAKVGVGFITATFLVHAEFQERVERERAKIGIRGQAPGSAVDGFGEMVLRDTPIGATEMDWSTEVNIHGTIASVGARLIEGTANKLIGQTFACFKSKLEVEGIVLTPPPAAAEAEAEAGIAASPGEGITDGVAAPTSDAAAETAASDAAVTGTAATEAAPAPAGASAAGASAAAPEATAARLHYLTEAIGPTGTNVYLIGNPDTGDALAVDVAHPSLAWVVTQLQARGWRLRYVVSTSGDWDHIGDNAALHSWATSRERTESEAGGSAAAGGGTGGPTLAVHPLERERLTAPARTFAPFEVSPSAPTLDLEDGARLRLGTIEFEVLHTPGHSPGAVSLFVPGAGLLISGDTLTGAGWGRTDLPGGSPQQMAASIRRLAELGDDVHVLPAHGPATTIGAERRWIDEVLAGRLLR